MDNLTITDSCGYSLTFYFSVNHSPLVLTAVSGDRECSKSVSLNERLVGGLFYMLSNTVLLPEYELTEEEECPTFHGLSSGTLEVSIYGYPGEPQDSILEFFIFYATNDNGADQDGVCVDFTLSQITEAVSQLGEWLQREQDNG